MTDWPVHPVADLFPVLGDGELRELADDIAERGLIEPIWLWDDPESGTMLLDGRTRLRACELASVPVRTRRYPGDDPLGFAIAENVKRRHLTPGQLAFLAIDSERLYAKANADKVGGRPRSDKEKPVADPRQVRKRKSAEQAAATTGASGRLVSAAKRIERDAPDLAEKVRGREKMALDRAERIVRDRQAEQRRVAQARAQAAAEPTPTTVDIRHGDFRDVLADLTGIDAIITDPPYPAEFLPLLADLSAWADKVLTPDGVMAVLIGQTHLPEVYRLLDGHRPYRWTGCYLTPGNGYVSHPRKVQSSWKPLLVYGGGPRFADVIRSEGTDAGAKSLHKWGQDYAAFHTLIERLTQRGQTVVDPFMGSGTTLLAAHALGRHAIGADIDAAAVRTSRERVS